MWGAGFHFQGSQTKGTASHAWGWQRLRHLEDVSWEKTGGRGIPEAVWGPQCAGPGILTASSEFGVV